jgi:tetratricopeptide (TPR) repeat protein
MPRKKSENILSARSDNRQARAGARAELVAGVAFASLLAACGGTTPTRPATESAAAPVPAETQALERSRRADRKTRTEETASRPEADAAAEVPENAQRSYQRALTAMASGNWTEAELELEQLLLEYGGFAGPYVNLAIVQMQAERNEEARAMLASALALDPAHAAANNQLGILLRHEGDFDAAEDAYRRAIESDPQYAFAYYNLGVLLDLYLRRQNEALEYYELYQGLLAEPDQKVGRWIIDLRRRLGVTDDAARLAKEN